MRSFDHCNEANCLHPRAAVLEGRPLCREHFIATARQQVRAYFKMQQEHRLGEIATASVRNFIRECLREADQIERRTRHLDFPGREELLDVILSAAELGRHLRRSVRKAAAVPLRLVFDTPARTVELAETSLLSRHGALVSSRHAGSLDERLYVERTDTGERAYARVAWCQARTEGRYELGIEFLDADNFWHLDWNESLR